PESDGGEFPALDRTLNLSSHKEELNLFLRPLVAANTLKIDEDGVVTVDGEWKLLIDGDVGAVFVRGKELVVPVELRSLDGKFSGTVKLRYEW
ncbi:MAG: hypothetical protein VX876_03875, partial [Planctomycetota bacterium]|nr:hypothetical protein [Planctomycetota bacterium]